MAGGVSARVREAIDRLLDLLAFMEAHLDFAEEPDVIASGTAKVEQALSRELSSLDDALSQCGARRRSGAVPRVVLIGPPNAGKSSLYNALAAGSRSALVSDIPGTTRDAVSAAIDCAGTTIDLFDTAGIDRACDSISQQASTVRENLAESADLVLICEPADGSSHADPNSNSPGRLKVITKCDLIAESSRLEGISTSSATGRGIDDLRFAIARALSDQPGESRGPSAISPRVAACLARARDRIAAALGVGPETPELAACDVRSAIDELGMVFGEHSTDDILDRVFSRFCIGK